MIIVNLADVVHCFHTQPVLNGLSWQIHSGQKIGLVGANGSGKSTLLRLIMGELTPDSGSIFRLKDLRIGYLAQEPVLDPSRTVWEEALSSDTALLQVEQRIRALELRLQEPEVYADETRLERALEALAQAQAEFERLDGYRHENRARGALLSLGFGEKIGLPISALSGGQKKMVGLAKLVATECDLLLLDEPDNHLDLEGKAHLDRLINGFAGTVVIVSHDRYFLDRIAERIVELDGGALVEYLGDYTYYCCEKARRGALVSRKPVASARSSARNV